MAIQGLGQLSSLAVKQVAQAARADKAGATNASPGEGFSKVLAEGLSRADKAIEVGDASAEQMVRSGGGNLHETMIALDKAEIATRLTVKVGQKLVNAYREVSQINV